MAVSSSTSDSIKSSLGSLAALKTLVSDFPITIDSILGDSSGNSFDFMVSIISMIDSTRTASQKKKAKKKAKNDAKAAGADDKTASAAGKAAANKVKKSDTLSQIQDYKDTAKSKICEIFMKIINQKFLDGLEYAVKGILFANFKNLFTCDLNPLIPDKYFFPATIKFPIRGNEESYKNRIETVEKKITEITKNLEEAKKNKDESKIKEYTNDLNTNNDKLTALKNQLSAIQNGYTKSYNGEGIDIKINDCDSFGLLSYCPLSDAASGSNLYFDTKERIYDNIDDNGKKMTRKKQRKNKKYEQKAPALTTQQLWQSCDFDAYLWWVINRRSSSVRPYTWDNRIKVMAELKDEATRTAFFDSDDSKFFNVKGKEEKYKRETSLRQQLGNDVSSDVKDIKRFGIVRCQFIEQSSQASNIIRVYLNPYRYVRGCFYLKSSKFTHAKAIFLNKTLFEFNYDYIWGLKLFDSKVLVAQIINSLFSISINTKATFSLKKNEIEAQLSEIIDKMITEEDTTVDNCYYSFSNAEYDEMLKKAKLKHEGIIQGKLGVNDELKVDADEINQQIADFGSATTLEEQETIINNIFTSVEETSGATDGETASKPTLQFANNMLKKLLKETVLQLVLQILTPKVALLFKINSAMMGNIDYTKSYTEIVNGEEVKKDELYDEPEFDSWSDFISNMKVLVLKLVLVIKDYVLQELLTYVISLIQPLVEAGTIMYAKEAIDYYRKGLQDLIDNCTFSALFKLNNGSSSASQIDNVNYADITEYATKPNYNTCSTNES